MTSFNVLQNNLNELSLQNRTNNFFIITNSNSNHFINLFLLNLFVFSL